MSDSGTYDAGPTFYKALLAACKEVTALGHDQTNTFSRYKYTSAESLIAYSRDLLNKHGLVVERHEYTLGEPLNEMDPSGKPSIHRDVTIMFRVVHEKGERMYYSGVFPACLTKGTPWDKAVAAALTTSLAYFLRDLLQIPRTGAGETMDERNDHADETPAPKGAKHPKRTKKSPAEVADDKAQVNAAKGLCLEMSGAKTLKALEVLRDKFHDGKMNFTQALTGKVRTAYRKRFRELGGVVDAK
jgi:hypothetical protein